MIRFLTIFILFLSFLGCDKTSDSLPVVTAPPEIESPKNPTKINNNDLIGTLKQKPPEGFQCYAVLPKDWDTAAAKRPYIFVMNEKSGDFNIAGKDVELGKSNHSETKGNDGKVRAGWIYKNKSINAEFDLSVEKLLNDGADVQYAGTLTVTNGSKSQTIPIKAFCGG